MENNLINVTNVRVELGGRKVFDHVSLSVSHGEFIGLLGPNGAGKTTLIRTILGLLQPQSGQVDAPQSMAYVPQRHDVAWDFPITVEQMVLNGRVGILRLKRPTAVDKQYVARALEQVGLTHLARRPIEELSGGQRQRVLIARALATGPQVLLLDEPFTGLDAPNMEALSALFQQLAQEGCSIIMSTHDLAHAAHACSRLVLFNQAVIADGTAREVVQNAPAWEQTFDVTADSPTLAVLKAV